MQLISALITETNKQICVKDEIIISKPNEIVVHWPVALWIAFNLLKKKATWLGLLFFSRY